MTCQFSLATYLLPVQRIFILELVFLVIPRQVTLAGPSLVVFLQTSTDL